jgi:hypothetical protein
VLSSISVADVVASFRPFRGACDALGDDARSKREADIVLLTYRMGPELPPCGRLAT